MLWHLLNPIFDLFIKTLSSIAPITIFVAVSLTVASKYERLSCNAGRRWWNINGLKTDMFYTFLIPFFIPQMRAIAAIGVSKLFYLVNAVLFIDFHGLMQLTELPIPAQVAIYVILNDFILYWFHRAFHGRRLWLIHAVHHSATDVDWTTSGRFHPLNFLMGSMLVSSALIYMGTSPVVVLIIAYPDALHSYLVHANLNFTFGPLKYLIASPVFHRWHHTPTRQAGNKNFGATFALWDVLFGTFHMPKGLLPDVYGLESSSFPTGFLGQLVFPFSGVPPYLRMLATKYLRHLNILPDDASQLMIKKVLRVTRYF